MSARAAGMAPSKLHIPPGSTITVDDAIKALVTKSANDVAAAIAENLGGSESNYAARMTRVAHQIGMNHTTFVNASGLPNPAQYTTARDMATLGLRLMRDFPQYYPYFRTTAFNFHGRTVKTHNYLVEHYAGTDGIKTGYIANAGFNLVTSTKRGDKRLVGVVLGARSPAIRERYMMSMLDRNFPSAREGSTVAALAGSSAGAINPIASAEQPKADAKVTQVNSAALAAVAADAAQAPADAQPADSDETVIASTGEAQPSVEASSATGKPQKLPFAVVSANDAPGTVANSSWNIQVGAFPAKEQADAKLAALRGSLGTVLTGKQSFTVQVENKGKYLYRARFAGFDAATAKKACGRISRLGTSCLAIAPQG